MEDRGHFPKLLREEREKLKLSQRVLAERAGLDHSMVSRVESGNRAGRLDVIHRIVNVFPDEETRDRLLAAAGYLPRTPAGYLGFDPLIDRLFTILRSDVPDSLREWNRGTVERAIERAESAIDSHKRQQEPSIVSLRPTIEVCPTCRTTLTQTGWETPPLWCMKCQKGMFWGKTIPLPLRSERKPNYWPKEKGEDRGAEHD